MDAHGRVTPTWDQALSWDCLKQSLWGSKLLLPGLHQVHKTCLFILNIPCLSHSQIHVCKKYFAPLHCANILIEYSSYYFPKMMHFNFLLVYGEHNISWQFCSREQWLCSAQKPYGLVACVSLYILLIKKNEYMLKGEIFLSSRLSL